MPQWNLLFGSFVGLYLLQLVLTLGMERLNRDHQQQQGVRVPEGFEGFMDEQKMKQTIAYSAERSRFGSIHLVFSELVFLGLILWGFFPFYVRFHYSHPPLVERIHRLRKSSD